MLSLLLTLAAPAMAGDLAVTLDPGVVADYRGAFALYVGDDYNGKLQVQGNETATDGAELVVTFTQLGSLEDVTWKEQIELDKKGHIVRIHRERGMGGRTLTVDKKGRITEVTESEELLDDSKPKDQSWDPPAEQLINPHLLLPVLPTLASQGPQKGDLWEGRLIDATVRGFPTAKLQWQGPMAAGEVVALQREVGPTQAYVIKDGAVISIVVQSAGIQWVAAPPEQLDQLHEQETIRRQKLRMLEQEKARRAQ
ncbi:MAG: hypothetical protein H6742_17745 [Alphaproteobacteria bacterium]|nr:hypothetical protein [Alphaproteobacteria bacterium]